MLGLDGRNDLRNPCEAFHALAVSVALLRAVDAAQANAFKSAIVQNFDGVAVEDGDDGVRNQEGLLDFARHAG